jgi:hypothetical protein
VVYTQPSLETLYDGVDGVTVNVREGQPPPPAGNVAACERLKLDLL